MSVYVFGSANIDVVAFVDRRPEIGETVVGSQLHMLPGGKGANQAVAAVRAGAATAFAGRLGDDAFGAQLLEFLGAEGVDLALTRRVTGASSGAALIVVAGADNAIVVVPGANALLDADAARAAPIAAGDIVVAQFETPQAATLAAFARAAAAGATTILNPAPLAPVMAGLLELSDVVVVNETELAGLVGAQPGEADPVAWALEQAGALRRRGGQTVLVTLGAAGVVVCDERSRSHVPGRDVRAVDTTGAGDCFVGNLAAALAGGATLDAAAQRANRAASLCVQAIGAAASMPTRAMVDAAAG
jgi:ribokinase